MLDWCKRIPKLPLIRSARYRTRLLPLHLLCPPYRRTNRSSQKRKTAWKPPLQRKNEKILETAASRLNFTAASQNIRQTLKFPYPFLSPPPFSFIFSSENMQSLRKGSFVRNRRFANQSAIFPCPPLSAKNKNPFYLRRSLRVVANSEETFCRRQQFAVFSVFRREKYYSGRLQSIFSFPHFSRNSLHFEKCLQPKNPL